MKSRSASPPAAALYLGWLGVIPFAVAALATLLGLPLWGSDRLWRFYGPLILSFMGGAQWGLAVGSERDATRRYVISVLPALAAWPSLVLSRQAACALLLCSFLFLLGYDRWTVWIGQAPAWYGRLRLRLSTAVCLCLTIDLIFGQRI